MGEIGRDRTECLYDMSHCEISLIVRGYRRRNILQYQLQRMNVWASMFCMGNPERKNPQDIIPLYFDNYKGQDAPPLSDRERQELQAEIDAMNAEYERKNRNR